MPGITIAFGLVLIAIGVIGYVATGMQHMTALIPAFAGAIFAALGLGALNRGARKHVMHAAAALAVLGFLGTARGLINFFRLIAGGTVERPAAVYAQAAMAVLCLIFVGLCVRSFVAARRARTTGEATAYESLTPPRA